MDQKQLWNSLQEDYTRQALAKLVKPVVLSNNLNEVRRVNSGDSVLVLKASPHGDVIVVAPDNEEFRTRIQCMPSESIPSPREMLTEIKLKS